MSPCIVWDGRVNRNGYGRLKDGRMAHRVAYERLVGPLPEGLVLDHRCRNRLCWNPRHLDPVSAKENTLRGEGPTAKNARKTHCVRGHKLPPPNKRGKRECVECRKARRSK